MESKIKKLIDKYEDLLKKLHHAQSLHECNTEQYAWHEGRIHAYKSVISDLKDVLK